MAEQSALRFITRPVVAGALAIIALAAGIGAGVGIQRMQASPNGSNRAAIEAMTPEEKATLRDRRTQFEEMSADEQQRVIAIQDAIDRSPDRDQLQATMLAYYDWLKQSAYYERQMLRDSSIAATKRVDHVKELRRDQATLVPIEFSDFSPLVTWLRKYVLSHQNAVAPSEYEDNDMKTLALAFMKWINHESPEIPEPAQEAYSELSRGLSQAVQQAIMNEALTNADRKEIVGTWIYRMLFPPRRPGGRGWRGAPPEIDSRDLLKFLSENLTKAQQEELTRLDLPRQTRLATYFYLRERNPDWWKSLEDWGGRGNRGNRGGEGRGDGRGGRGRQNRGNGPPDGQRNPNSAGGNVPLIVLPF